MPVPLHGILVVDKPGGMTSAAVVARVKRIVGGKVGHTGTLDPMATGVLPLCLGEGTKIAGYLTAEDKAYLGQFELGAETDTLDREGTVVHENRERALEVTDEALRQAMHSLEGEQEQIPPMYSAVKVGGRRLHALARAGQDIERPSRRIRIDRFRLLERQGVRCDFEVACSKGTYVRTLVADLGRALGSYAHLTDLRRTRSGSFTLAQAVQLEEISMELVARRLVGPAEALDFLPSQQLTSDLVDDVRCGKPLPWKCLADTPPPAGPLCLHTPAGALLAIVEIENERLSYRRVFTYGLTSAL